MPNKKKRVINPRPNKLALVLIALFCVVVFFGGYFLTKNLAPNKFKIEPELYGTNEAIDIKKDDYEKLIETKKSFVILVDKPDCYTSENVRGFMAEFPDDIQFKYYRIMWSQMRDSSLHEQVKFAPSVAIIRSGQVVDFLDADSDEDTAKYNDAQALQNWITKYIDFN